MYVKLLKEKQMKKRFENRSYRCRGNNHSDAPPSFRLQGKIAGIVKTEGNKMLNAQFDFKKLNISLFRNFPQASVTLEDFWLKGAGGIRKRYPCTSRRGDCHHQSVLPFRRQRL